MKQQPSWYQQIITNGSLVSLRLAIMNDTSAMETSKLIELAKLFLKLGSISLGGPAAHIAMMEDEVVRRKQWLTQEEFLDLLGAANLIPGPNSTELAIHIGHRHAGLAGLVVAGICFIFPAVAIVTVMAWFYVKLGDLPQTEGILTGVRPVIVVIVIQALWRLGCTAVKSWTLAFLALVAVVANACGLNELLVLIGIGALTALIRAFPRARAVNSALYLSLLGGVSTFPITSAAASAVAASAPFTLWSLFLFFLKTGSVLFGSGYVLLAFLRADLVERWNWLTSEQLLDAISVGQVTPGPVFTTATFIGFNLGGLAGAFVATVGIFVPAFLFVALSAPFIPRLRQSLVVGALLDGVNVASLALMAVVTWELGRGTLTNLFSIVVLVASALMVSCYRINVTWLVPCGACAGLLHTFW